MGERLDIFEERMQQIQFDDIQDDEFVAVTTVKSSAANPAVENGGSDNGTSSPTNGHEANEDEDSKSPNKQQDPADSMRTEDLDEESAEDVQPPEEQ